MVGAMKHDTLSEAGQIYAPCRYGSSRLFFRGPRRPLDGRYIAFVGGTETYGKFVGTPFPALVEDRLGVTCVNFGCVNASVEAFLKEPAIVAACRDAELTVVEITGAHNLSNRFYSVHPRRNDRFVRASTILSALYPEVDFTEFCFTRHMLRKLSDLDADRFSIVREELQIAWSARMRTLLREIGGNTLLLWFAEHLPSDAPFDLRPQGGWTDPLFITRRMVDQLRPHVRGVVMASPSARALARRGEGLIHLPHQADAAAGLLGVAAHEEAATALTSVLQAQIAA
jgi:Domain of unknown function (DUF6473)